MKNLIALTILLLTTYNEPVKSCSFNKDVDSTYHKGAVVKDTIVFMGRENANGSNIMLNKQYG